MMISIGAQHGRIRNPLSTECIEGETLRQLIQRRGLAPELDPLRDDSQFKEMLQRLDPPQ